MSLNVLVAAGIYPPTIGGPATHLEQLLPQLLTHGHRLRVVAFGDRSDGPDRFPVVRVSGAHWTTRALRYAAAIRGQAGWADVIYATSMGLPRGAARRPVLLRVPGDLAWERAVNRGLVPPTEDIDTFQRARHGVRVTALKRLRRREAQRADQVVVPSAYLRDMVAGWNVVPAKIAVVPSAVATARHLPGEPHQPADMRDACRLQIVAPARLTPWKGIDLAIDALAGADDVVLTVVGDGPLRAALEARARARQAPVTFLGDRPPDVVRALMRAADYCLVYSGYEGLSHTLLESLSVGTPVIASRRGGNPEIVAHGINGLLVPHPDVAALAATLKEAADPDLRARLRTGAAAPLDRFSIEQAAAGISRELERLAGRAG